MKFLDRLIAAVACLVLLTVCYQWLVVLDFLPSLVAQTVDVRPVTNTFFETAVGSLAAVLTVVGTIGIRIAMNYVGLSNSNLERELNERLDNIIHMGIGFARTTYENEMKKNGSGLAAVKVDNFFLKMVIDYVQPSAMGILTRFKIDRIKLEEMIMARIPAHFTLASTAEPIAGGISSTPAVAAAVRETGGPSDDLRG